MNIKKEFSTDNTGFGLKFKIVCFDYLKITFGALLMGTALSLFLVPFKIAPGGISGLATILHYLIGIKVSYLILFINIPIFVLGLIKLKKGFLIKSLYGTVILSLSTDIAAIFKIPVYEPLTAAAFGGIIMGFGIATVLSTGGTTGGTDILVLIIRKTFDFLSVGRVYLIIDGIIITLAGIVFSSGETVFYSMITLMISTYVTDAATEGFNLSRLVYIISDHSDEICTEIYSKLKRGVTALKSVSIYMGGERQVLMCVIRKRQLFLLKSIIQNTDKSAFVVICDAKEVMGKGFIDKL